MLIKDLYRKTAKLKGVKLLKMQQKTRTFKDLAKGAWRARRARAYNGGLGRSLQRGPGAQLVIIFGMHIISKLIFVHVCAYHQIVLT